MEECVVKYYLGFCLLIITGCTSIKTVIQSSKFFSGDIEQRYLIKEEDRLFDVQKKNSTIISKKRITSLSDILKGNPHYTTVKDLPILFYSYQFNHDSTFVAFTYPQVDLFNVITRGMSVYDVRSGKIYKHQSHELTIGGYYNRKDMLAKAQEKSFYMVGDIGSKHSVTSLCSDLGNPVRWIDSTTFIMSQKKGLFKYKLDSLIYPTELSSEEFRSDYFFIDSNKVISSNSKGIVQVDITSKKSSQLVKKRGVFNVTHRDSLLYFATKKGYHRYNLKSKKMEKLHKSRYDILKTWYLSPTEVVIWSGIVTREFEKNILTLSSVTSDQTYLMFVNNYPMKDITVTTDKLVYFHTSNKGKPASYVYDVSERKLFKGPM